MGSTGGELVTETLGYGGGREVTVFVPSTAPGVVVYAGDGQLLAPWGADVTAHDIPPTMVVGVHRLDDEMQRLHEYSPGFDPERFATHETFVMDDVRSWVRDRFGLDLPRERTATFGVSASGELALALGVRHPDVFGAVLCASPGGGYRPPEEMPTPLPRTYLVAGTDEPFFAENARRWHDALRVAGADVVMTERAGGHGGAFWRQELAAMVTWVVGEAR